MTTLRDALSSAFEAADSGELAVVNEPQTLEIEESPSSVSPAETVEKPSRNRDEVGRFAKISDESAKSLDPKEEVKADLPTTRKPPSSWKKDYWGHWEKVATNPELSPLADYIEQRESEFAKGVSTYKEEATKAKALQDAIAPFVPDMQRYGVQPEVEIRNLLNAHHTLIQADPQQRLQMFAKLATDYGVPLQALTGQNYDPQSAQLMQDLNALKSQFGQIYQTQQQREQAEIASKIDEFKANAPFFDEAREAMAGLLQAGMAGDLKTAYDKALRLNDDLWKKEQARQAEAAEKERQMKLNLKKATAVSPKSSSPTGRVGGVSGGKDLRSILGAAFEQHTNGRL
jgi:hypothetical protein